MFMSSLWRLTEVDEIKFQLGVRLELVRRLEIISLSTRSVEPRTRMCYYILIPDIVN